MKFLTVSVSISRNNIFETKYFTFLKTDFHNLNFLRKKNSTIKIVKVNTLK